MVERPQSEYNSSFDSLGRLGALFATIDESSSSMNISAWHHYLLTVKRELSTIMKAEEIAMFNKEFKELFYYIDQFNLMSAKRFNTSIPGNIYWKLDELETRLRIIADNAGLLIKKREDISKPDI